MAINTGDLLEVKERSSYWKKNRSKNRAWAGVRASVVAQASREGREQTYRNEGE
jgi:hypothetical protein